MSRAAAFASVLALIGCAGNPQQLPVGVSHCAAVAAAQRFAVEASVSNQSDRPITALALSAQFYQNFRYARYDASARLDRELDPGRSRTIRFDLGADANPPNGQAIRCIVTRIGYMDGTSQDAPPQ